MKRNSYLPLTICAILGSTLAVTACHSNGPGAAAGRSSGATASVAATVKSAPSHSASSAAPVTSAAPGTAGSAATASPSQSSPSPVASAGAPVPHVVADCSEMPDTMGVRPKGIVIACADDGLGVEKMTWTNWGTSTAKGQGELYENLCQPNCAEGKIETYPVLVTLSRVKNSSQGAYFSELTVTWEGNRPLNSTPDIFGLLGPTAS